MTVDQVAQASKGQLRPCDNSCDGHKSPGSTPRLFGPYKTGEFSFTAFATFDQSGRLSSVLLNSRGDHGYALAAALRNKYGEPATKSHSAVLDVQIWRDQKDQITWVKIGDGPTALVNLTYQPRITESNKGL